MTLVQFRLPKKQADALAVVQEANGKTEADVLRDAVTWYLGSSHVHQRLKFGQLMQAIREGKIELAAVTEGDVLPSARDVERAAADAAVSSPCGLRAR